MRKYLIIHQPKYILLQSTLTLSQHIRLKVECACSIDVLVHVMKTKIPPFDSVKQYQLNPHDRFSRYQHCSDLWPLKVKRDHPEPTAQSVVLGVSPGRGY